jgi:hypothetical protein
MRHEVSPETLRGQRNSPAVLKIRLAQIRESSPCTVVIVVEGRDDVAVYDIWIKLAVGTFVWEPLVAHGKEGVLAFRDLLLRDKMKLLPCTFLSSIMIMMGLATGWWMIGYLCYQHTLSRTISSQRGYLRRF